MILFSQANSMKTHIVKQVTSQSFWEVTRSHKVAELEKEVRSIHALFMSTEDVAQKKLLDDQKKEVKAKLPGFIPHALMGKSRSKGGVLHMSGMIMFDADHCDDVEGTIEMLKSRIEELGILYIGISTSGDGVRVFFLCPDGMTIEEAQIWFSDKTGMERDHSTHDPARFSYAVTESNIKYINEAALFEGEVIKPWSDDVEVMSKKADSIDKPSAARSKKDATFEVDADNGTCADSYNRSALIAELLTIPFDASMTIQGVKCKLLFDEYFKQSFGIEPGPGQRHLPIGKAIMHLAPTFGSDPKLMMAATPRYGISDKELAELIADKLNWTKSNPNYAGPAAKVENMISNVLKENRDMWEHSPYPTIEEAIELYQSLPKQPKWVQEWLSIIPECVRYPALIAATPREMTLADQVTCKYENFRPTDLASSSVVMGPSGGYKGAAMAPAEELMIVLEEDTKAEQRRENEYLLRREMEKEKKNSKVVFEEEVFNIRYLPNDTTKNRHIEALRCGRTTYTQSAELSALFDSMKKPAYDRKSFFLLCFDRSPVGSQTKSGTGGVNDTQPCRWNYMCGANIQSLYKAYPETALTTGDVFRLTIVTVPNTFGHQSEMYVSQYTNEQKRLIHRVGELLMKCEGQTVTPRLSKAIHEWHVKKEKELLEQKDYEGLMLLGRLPLISYRIGQVMHLNWGIDSILKEEKKAGKELDIISIDASLFKERKETIETTLIIADHLYDTMCCFFKKRLKSRNLYELDLVSTSRQSKGSHFFEELPDTPFDYEMLKNNIWKGANDTTIRIRIHRLLKEKKIELTEKKGRMKIYQKKAL